MRTQRDRRRTFPHWGWLAVVILAGCDPYTCSDETCPNGAIWRKCYACETSGALITCVTEARDDRGAVLRECEYGSDDRAGREGCSDRVEAAGAYWCETGMGMHGTGGDR